jgi:alpha-tubulin suppressor-like RCC1 family protein
VLGRQWQRTARQWQHLEPRSPASPPASRTPSRSSPPSTTTTACALLGDGTAKCWGYNANGSLGDGSVTSRNLPVAVSGLTSATQLSAGRLHTCALISDGTAKCWGLNGNGQIGDNSTTQRTTPTVVSGLAGATWIDAGYNHTCAILGNTASAKCWGGNANGQIGDSTTTQRPTPTTVLSFP